MSALLADKGYDGDNLRAEIASHGAKPVIPNKSNRVVIHRFNKRAYKGRNAMKPYFCQLKDLGVSPPGMTGPIATFSPPSNSMLSSLLD